VAAPVVLANVNAAAVEIHIDPPQRLLGDEPGLYWRKILD
jgi:hypothetical protein